MLKALIIAVLVSTGGREYSVEAPLEKAAKEVKEVSLSMSTNIKELAAEINGLKQRLKKIEEQAKSAKTEEERDSLWWEGAYIRSEISKIAYELLESARAQAEELNGKLQTLGGLLAWIFPFPLK